jgi:rhomboid protease GluP
MGALITCQKCRALLEPGTRECPYCHTDQRHHRAPTESQDAEKTTRFGFWILGWIVAIYVLMVLLDPARGDPGTKPYQPSGVSLIMFGAPNPYHVQHCGQYWRLLAAMFLHVDPLHLALNSIALLFLIPIAAGAFGVHRTVCVYLVSGICGSCLSQLGGATGVGASGALCGLIGASAVYGWRRGGAMGRELTRQMIRWAILIAVFGLIVRNIDNLGHLGGFVGGAAIGFLAAGPRARGGRADRAWTFAARACVVVALVVAAVFWAPFVLRIFERRDIELFQRQAERTIRAIEESLDSGDVATLPVGFTEGPSGTEAVHDAVREALDLARRHDPGAAGALTRAEDALSAWSSTLLCTYALH